MGNLETGKTNLEKSKKRSMETEERGNEISKEGEMIAARIKEIQCEDEVVENTKETAEDEYRVSFETAFAEDVEIDFDEIDIEVTETNTELGEEMGKVEEGASLFAQAGEISEIGRETADKSHEIVKERAGEYGDAIKEGDTVLAENEAKGAELKRQIESYF